MRGMKGGNEIECLSRKSRRLAKLRPEHIRAAKRSFWKRQRSEAKRSARLAARDEVEAPPIGGLSSEPVRCRVAHRLLVPGVGEAVPGALARYGRC